MDNNIRRLGIIGAGVIGVGWSVLLAVKGYEVNLYTRRKETLESAKVKVNNALKSLRDFNLIDNDPDYYASKIKYTTEMDEAINSVDMVIEAVIEDYNAKKAVFRYLDEKLDKEIIIGSSTSGLLMTEIQKVMNHHPERGVIIHPWNPVYLMPLVEIVPGEKTSKEVVDKAKEFVEKLDRVPVVLKKEVPGFIGNRLAFALLREAVEIVDQGIVSIEDIDKVVMYGLGPRFAFMGPFLTYHLGGGEGGLEYFFSKGFGAGANEWMYTLAKWDKFPYRAVVKAIEQMKDYSFIKGKSFQELSRWRDQKLIEVLKVTRGKII